MQFLFLEEFWREKNHPNQLNSSIEIKGNKYWLSNPFQEKKSLYMYGQLLTLSFSKFSIVLPFERE